MSSKEILDHSDQAVFEKGFLGIHFISSDKISIVVKVWLAIGLFMVFMQVVIGGVTRLTGSGLSITKWEIVTGTIPPLTGAQWVEEFELYKATPQYQKINEGMNMSEFKFIYFWEFLHRFWARGMGFVFAIPFFYFLATRKLSKQLVKDLGIVVLFAALAASFGWIMVASGLVHRPWVNAYKLTIHLSLGFLVFSYLLWTIFKVFQPHPKVIHKPMLKKLGKVLTFAICIQIILGGLMSGTKAGLQYPTFPDMNGKVFPEVIFDGSEWNVDNLVDYDKNGFTPAIIQVMHRGTAYLLIIIGLCYIFYALKVKESSYFTRGNIMLITMLGMQILLGILTIINCMGSIPVGLGVAHQAGALLLLSVALFLNYQLRLKKQIKVVDKHVEKNKKHQ